MTTRKCAFVFLAMSFAWIWSRCADAQETIVRAGDLVDVHTISTREILRGIVLDSADGTVRLRVDGYRVDIPMDDVWRIDLEVHDSLVNGTLIGAAVMGVMCMLICDQGLDGADNLPRVVFGNIVVGAAIGAVVDWNTSSHQTVYERPKQLRQSGRAIAVPLLTLRF